MSLHWMSFSYARNHAEARQDSGNNNEPAENASIKMGVDGGAVTVAQVEEY
jgi:hypothetical protein